MSISRVEHRALARDLQVSNEDLTVHLRDGRSITVPLWWYPRLRDATPGQRQNWELLGEGEGIHWPDIDEHLSVAGLLSGNPAPGARPPNQSGE